MGIEKFFNSIKKSYGDKIIKKYNLINLEFNKSNSNNINSNKTINQIQLIQTHLYLDFNSIIHNISQSVSNSLVILYHLFLVANIKPDILRTHKTNFIDNLNNLSTYDKFNLNGNIILPDQFTENSNTHTDTNKYDYSIVFNKLSIDDITESFFQLLVQDNNLDKLIIHKVYLYVKLLMDQFPNLIYLYLAIDGVPLYAKIIEQRKRRTIGNLINQARNLLTENYKSELDIQPTLDNSDKTDIYYNHYKFELFIKKLKFDKNKISPATQFMINLETYIESELILLNESRIKSNIQIKIDSFNNFGEGEKKIVLDIVNLLNNQQTKQTKQTNQLMVYSPDADVILLMLLEVAKYGNKIDIMRYDQQLRQTDIININKLNDIILEYVGINNGSSSSPSSPTNNKHIIIDIVMLFTILGNDFLPKLNEINTNKHIKIIFEAYSLIDSKNNGFIFSENINSFSSDPVSSDPVSSESANLSGSKVLWEASKIINWSQLKNFFIQFKVLLKNQSVSSNKLNKFRPKEWTIEPDQIINSNAFDFYHHLFNIENMTDSYDPMNTLYEKPTIADKIKKRACRKYIQGYIWLSLYYLNHNDSYKLFVYTYDIVPTIDELIQMLDFILTEKEKEKEKEKDKDKDKKILNKIEKNLLKTIIKNDIYLNPVQQLLIISPFNVDKILGTKYKLDKKTYDWIKLFYKKYVLSDEERSSLQINNNKINIYTHINCEGAFYLSKCKLIKDTIFNHPHKLVNIINKFTK